MPLACIRSYLKSVLRNTFLIWDTYHPDVYVYVSNDVGIRGYFSKPNGFCEQKKLWIIDIQYFTIFLIYWTKIYILTRNHAILYTWVRASWTDFNNCPTRCDLFSLLYFCRQLYMFQVLTPIIRSSYNSYYSFWYWLTAMNKNMLLLILIYNLKF